jgi:hypothetical protein
LQTTCTYFETTGEENTDRTLALVGARLAALELDTVLVASTTGATALRAAEHLHDAHIIAVTHATGFREPDLQQLTPEMRTRLTDAGVELLTCQHALGGVGRAVRKQLGGHQANEIIAHTLRCFGQGTKVAVEIALMAADAGRVSTQAPVISVGGSGRGADTAVLLQPVNAQRFFDIQPMEIICMPSPKHPAFQ